MRASVPYPQNAMLVLTRPTVVSVPSATFTLPYISSSLETRPAGPQRMMPWQTWDASAVDARPRHTPPPSHPAPRTPSERSASVFTVTVRTPSSTVRGIECAVRSHDEILYHICCCCCYVCTPPVRPQAIRGRASVFKSLLNTVIPERSPPRAARTNAQCHSFC